MPNKALHLTYSLLVSLAAKLYCKHSAIAVSGISNQLIKISEKGGEKWLIKKDKVRQEMEGILVERGFV